MRKAICEKPWRMLISSTGDSSLPFLLSHCIWAWGYIVLQFYTMQKEQRMDIKLGPQRANCWRCWAFVRYFLVIFISLFEISVQICKMFFNWVAYFLVSVFEFFVHPGYQSSTTWRAGKVHSVDFLFTQVIVSWIYRAFKFYEHTSVNSRS